MRETYDLASTSHTTSKNLMLNLDLAGSAGEVSTNQIVDSKLNSLLWSNTNQLWQDTGVQTLGTLISDYLLGTVERVLVKHLANAGGTLILHTGLDKVNWVDHEGPEGAGQRTECEVVNGLQDRAEDVLSGSLCDVRMLLCHLSEGIDEWGAP